MGETEETEVVEIKVETEVLEAVKEAAVAKETEEAKEREGNGRHCCICSSSVDLIPVQDKWICEKCLDVGIEKLTLPWKVSLEALFNEYYEACNRYISFDTSEDVHQARIIGRKIRAMLEFIGLPKKHRILLPITEIHRMLNKVREADVFIVEMKQKSADNNVYKVMAEAASKRQLKQKKQIAEEIPALFDESYHQKVETFINDKLVLYIVQLEKENVLYQYEERFNRVVDAYRQSVEKKGKTSADTIKALHAIRKKSKSLRYIYSFLNDAFENRYQDKESYYKNLQRKFGEINDVEDCLYLIKEFQKKSPKGDIDNVKKGYKVRLQELLENVELFQAPIE